MSKNRWGELLEKVKHFDPQKSNWEIADNGQLEKTARILNERHVFKSLKKATILLGVSCASLAVQIDGSWVTRSPLFEILGTGLSFIILVGVLLAGCVFYAFSAENSVITWSISMLPIGVEPYRSTLGIVGFFLFLAFGIPRLARIIGIGINSLHYVRIALWILGLSVLIGAVVKLLLVTLSGSPALDLGT